MGTHYEIDRLDRQILGLLLEDARMPFLEIARKLIVSGGTIHQRVEKMKEAGIITGSKITVDYEKLGLGVTVLIGIHLRTASAVETILENLKELPEVVEAYYTSGTYALIVKVRTRDIKDFHRFLVEELQHFDQIRYTESFICLDQPLDRDIQLDLPPLQT